MGSIFFRGIAAITLTVLLTFLGFRRSHHAILGHDSEAIWISVAILVVFVLIGISMPKRLRRKFYFASLGVFSILVFAYYSFGVLHFDDSNTMDGKSVTAEYARYLDSRDFLLPLGITLGILAAIVFSKSTINRDITSG